MGTINAFHVPADVPDVTLTGLFVETVERFGSRPAYTVLVPDGPPATRSYHDVAEAVRRGAGALRRMGLRRGDRAAILSENRIEWPLADFACLAAGIVDVPIYSTLTAAQVGYILKDSGTSLVFVSDAEQRAKVQEAVSGSGLDPRIVVFDGDTGGSEAIAWDDFLRTGEDFTAEEMRQEALRADPDDVATLIYTSGTTGNPKGVMLTHQNVASNVWAAGQLLPVSTDDSSLSFLPLSHVLQRTVDYIFFAGGCVIAHCTIDRVSEEMRRLRPTKVVSVPRLYEKVYQRVTTGHGIKGRLARWAASVGREWEALETAGRSIPLGLGLRYRIADRLVYSRIREGLGGRLQYFVSGGAPLAPDINRFFYAAGVRILEGYGLTETSPVTNVNTLEHFRIGTVGRPIPGTEIRIAQDGEILVRGPQVMKGYYQLPEQTKEVLDAEGWLSTGDIGELSEDGFLTITDRKKDLIKTSGGKYIAPQPIENRLKKTPLVDQAVVVGEGRNFVSVLVVPDVGRLRALAAGRGTSEADLGTLLDDPDVQKALSDAVFGALSDLARYEMPKKIGLLRRPFTIEDGTLTPTHKVKRREVLERYADFIDGFYRDEAVEQTVFMAPA